MTVETTDAWRGVAAEGAQDITEAGSVFLRRRSRRLLGELLRPYRRIAWLLLLAVLIENAARLSIPWLVQRGIDLGIPPLAGFMASSACSWRHSTPAAAAGAGREAILARRRSPGARAPRRGGR